MVSPKHANFLVNSGTATAADIAALAEAVKREVERRTGAQRVPGRPCLFGRKTVPRWAEERERVLNP